MSSLIRPFRDSWLPLLLLAVCILLPLPACAVDAEFNPDAAPPPSSARYNADVPTSTTPSDSDRSALVFDWSKNGSHEPVILTDKNFFDLVIDSRQPWIVAFVAPWCGHCRALHEPFAKASRQLLSTVRLGTVDCTKEQTLASKFKVASFPTIMTFPAGKKTPKSMQKYEGQRDANAIAAFAKGMLSMKLLRLLESSHVNFPNNLFNFFHGGASKGYVNRQLPSLLFFLHAHKPSDEIKAISQSFDSRFNFGVIGKDDKALRRLFRVRSTPAYLFCLPATFTQANQTGIIQCHTYDHAAKKGGGTSVPAVSRHLVNYLSLMDSDPQFGSVNKRYPSQRIVLDEKKANAHGETSTPGEAADAAPISLPAPVSSSVDFHAACTDSPLGVCLLAFAEILNPGQDPTSANRAAQVGLSAIRAAVKSWNELHPARKSGHISLVLVPSSSAFAATLSNEFHASIDTNPNGITLLALLPKRNRFANYLQIGSSFVKDDAIEWLERVAADAKIKLEKAKDVKQILQSAAKDDVSHYLSTYVYVPLNAEDISAVHEDL